MGQHAIFLVCSHGISARTKLPKTALNLVGHPSANYQGRTLKNLENILSSPLGFHLRENAPHC